MILRIPILIACVLVALSLAQGNAGAQVPPHRPGTICFTPEFWCWANPPGRPGAVCYCPSRYGRVQGRLG